MRIDLFLLFISFLYLYLLTTMKVSQILEMRIVLFISTTRSQRSFWSVICDLVVHKIRHNFPFCKQVSIFGILIMMIMTTTNSISTIILVQIKISYLVDKLFIIFCYLRTLMMMMEATTEKKADNLSATKSMLVFLCRSIYWKICCGLFFCGQINRKVSRFLLILRLCNLATLTIMVIMIKVIWSDPAHRLTGALLVLVDMSATFLVNTC